MDMLTVLGVFVAGLFLGAFLVWLLERSRHIERTGSLAAQALQHNSETFLQLAKTSFEHWQSVSRDDLSNRQKAITDVVAPLKESLEKVDVKVRELELLRQGAFGALSQQLQSLLESQNKLQLETQTLSKALHTPTVRGRWGEIQLRRVVELAGMVAHCDFQEQVSMSTQSGGIRPDVVVRLPGNKCVVVDAKAPLSAYLHAVDAKEESGRLQHMREYAEHVRRHIQQLSKKNYFQHMEQSPEFVVMFLPGEIFFSAALGEQPDLIEYGVELGVILATPTTLIALLRAVAYGWRNEAMTENAQRISQLANTLVERIGKVAEHFDKLGRSLKNSVDAYNQTLGSMESRVMPVARKLQEMGHVKEAREALLPVEAVPRSWELSEIPATHEDTDGPG